MKSNKRIIALILLAAICIAFCGCSAEQNADTEPQFRSLDDLAGKRIATVTGTIFDTIVPDYIKNPEFVYYNSTPDMSVALDTNKADAYVADEPIATYMINEHPSHEILQRLTDEEYAFLIGKTEKRDTLYNQINEYLAKIKANGTMDDLKDIWLGTDEQKQVIDFSNLPAPNGTLNFCVTTSNAGAPFTYINDGKFCGYDIDMAVRFCREYGYGINIQDMNFAGMLASLDSGKSDFGASSVAVTEERKNSGFLFSEPNYYGGLVVVVKNNLKLAATSAYNSLNDLKGKKLGTITGSIFYMTAEERIDDVTIDYYNTAPDLPQALDAGKIDGYIADEPVVRILIAENPTHRLLDILAPNDNAFIFPKTAEGAKLRDEFNKFLAEIKDNGTLETIDAVWFGRDESAKLVDLDSLTGENGTLNYATCSSMAPFSYIKDGKLVGYEVDIAARFCKKYGYKLSVSDSDFTGTISAVSTGKCSFGSGSISVTEERKESLYFSDPSYSGGVALVVKSGVPKNRSAFSGIIESFKRTFIKEERWKLFVTGIGTTLFITILAVVFGTIIGFSLFMIYRKKYKVFNIILGAIMDIMEKTPVVVIIMILYYIIFGSIDLPGFIVAAIGFSIMFACSFIRTVDIGVKAIDNGQNEAALSLGFSDSKAFIHIILPQAARHFLPNYRGNIVSLLKDTAIVGYIAVQDLTKIGDIIRSRTYEAFFPLIATALIYFGLAWALTLIVKHIEFRFDPKNRKSKKILKGVKTK